MGKIIDRVRQRQHALWEKERARRSLETDMAIMSSLHSAYGGRNFSVVGRIAFLVVCFAFFVWCGYAIFWR